MKIAVLQTDIRWGDISANIFEAGRLLDSAPNAELYVLPEMFTTGFNSICEEAAKGCPAGLEFLKNEAAKRNCALAGSICLSLEDGMKANRLYFVTPDSVQWYDKRHLFNYGGEGKEYRAGDRRTVVEWKGVRFLLTICYDLRFPVWTRNRNDYDVMICVASWPVQRRYAWDCLLKARAIENQCYVVAANRVGTDPSCTYDGGSVILDPSGKTVSACRDSKVDIAIGEADMEMLSEMRSHFPVLADSDDFYLIS